MTLGHFTVVQGSCDQHSRPIRSALSSCIQLKARRAGIDKETVRTGEIEVALKKG